MPRPPLGSIAVTVVATARARLVRRYRQARRVFIILRRGGLCWCGAARAVETSTLRRATS